MEVKEINTKLDEPRKRKKKLINEVKELLEFYFSPSNVSKDKFMQKLLDADPYIDIEMFHKFNKIKKFTNENKILVKAINKSDILELSEDGLKVKTKLPLQMKDNEMECTIYVENLPPNTTHEWLRKVFSPYGTIDYISLPMFHQSGRPKGFSFIEFHSPDEAQKALEAFGGGLASLDGTLNPADLLTITTYGQAEMEIKTENSEATKELGASGSPSQNISDDISSKKRKCTEAFSAGEDNSSPDSKKTKSEMENEPKKKKKRKRNKKDKEYEVDKVYLRVMSKKEWKSLRNKYLNIQRENMKELKYSINYNNQSYTNQSYQSEYRLSHSNQYNYVDMQESKKTIKQESKTCNKPEYIPNVIAKVTLKAPPHNPKDFRGGLTNGRTSIAYVDVSTENTDIFIRFKSSEACNDFLEEGLYSNVSLVQGEDEKQYWDKILTSWEQKRPKNKKKTVKNDESSTLRGKDKLVDKAVKFKEKQSLPNRIVFDD